MDPHARKHLCWVWSSATKDWNMNRCRNEHTHSHTLTYTHTHTHATWFLYLPWRWWGGAGSSWTESSDDKDDGGWSNAVAVETNKGALSLRKWSSDCCDFQQEGNSRELHLSWDWTTIQSPSRAPPPAPLPSFCPSLPPSIPPSVSLTC